MKLSRNNPIGSIPFERIRERLSISYLWRRFNLPGNPGKNVRSPFRKDTHPSFSVYLKSGIELWFDHATGKGGDVVDFYEMALSCDKTEAARACQKIIDGESQSELFQYQSKEEAEIRVHWPIDIRKPTELECIELAVLRKLSARSFWLAGELGTLRVGTHKGTRCWITTDCANRNAEARRFDGGLFPEGQKAMALYGSRKDLPVGLATTNLGLDRINRIVLCEGAPDYYALLQLAIDHPINFRPCAMLGASCSIRDGAFEGTDVLIIRHNDPTGKAAAERWGQELYSLGARRVSGVTPAPYCDLNEALSTIGDGALDILSWLMRTDPIASNQKTM